LLLPLSIAFSLSFSLSCSIPSHSWPTNIFQQTVASFTIIHQRQTRPNGPHVILAASNRPLHTDFAAFIIHGGPEFHDSSTRTLELSLCYHASGTLFIVHLATNIAIPEPASSAPHNHPRHGFPRAYQEGTTKGLTKLFTPNIINKGLKQRPRSMALERV
jgi:hypothetical protein